MGWVWGGGGGAAWRECDGVPSSVLREPSGSLLLLLFLLFRLLLLLVSIRSVILDVRRDLCIWARGPAAVAARSKHHPRNTRVSNPTPRRQITRRFSARLSSKSDFGTKIKEFEAFVLRGPQVLETAFTYQSFRDGSRLVSRVGVVK